MTDVAYTAAYVTQVELGRAYQRLGHTSPARPWRATLLINPELVMAWACRVLDRTSTGEDPARYTWHVIADAGELDWPPLRPEGEVWPALLAKEPVPTGDRAEQEAQWLGTTVEEMHRARLRDHYLGDAHSIGLKRRPADINFDPLVRDWDATARELAHYLDTHQPPRLTVDQRIMEQGARLAKLEAETESAKRGLARLVRNARDAQGEQLRRGFKADLARWSGRTRPTIDAWLTDTTPDQDNDATQAP
ncbi:hypothetical protein ACFWFV_28315 [Streptomyces diastaticus]|uniref:hypothetical protein n=1 Tax=Streptomyces diastaticus TaxID=1956 RepID=UPI00364C522A